MELTGRDCAGGRFGKCEELCYLADTVARPVFEVHAEDIAAATAYQQIHALNRAGQFTSYLKLTMYGHICSIPHYQV